MKNQYCLIAVIALLLPLPGISQKKSKVKIIHAKKLTSAVADGKNVRKLVGDVIFEQDNVRMYCDSAYQYAGKNSFDAFGNIRIEQGDSLELTGELLKYNGNDKKAVLENNVTLREKGMTLTTGKLFFNLRENLAYYRNKAVIRDSVNKLISKQGYYYSRTEDMYFRDSVRLFNPRYTIYGDTLRYHSPSQIAYFYGPTRIISNTNYIYCENGWYDTRQDLSRFGKNAYLKSKGQYIFGDSLFYDRHAGFGKARKNIRVVDTAENIMIKGQFAEYFERKDETFITDSILVEKYYEDDTLYIHSDTLWALPDSSEDHRIFRAYYDVKTFSNKFQSKCDSLIYTFRDSIITLYRKPVFWINEYQVTGEMIKLFTTGSEINRIKVNNKGLIVYPSNSPGFNQIKGKDITGYLKNNELNRIWVEGNGQAVYYLKDEDGKYIGINKIESSNISMRVKDKKIYSLNFINAPDAIVHPIKDKAPEEMRLEGFQWRAAERPAGIRELYFP